MHYRESINIGVEGLHNHLLRSILSMLGIIFGVGAVIAMLSIGEGAKQEALDQIQLMGMNNIIVMDIPRENTEGQTDEPMKSLGLARLDAFAVQELNPLVQVTVPIREKKMDIRYGRELMNVPIIGTMPEYIQVMNYQPSDGTFFSYQDVEQVKRVCVLGNTIKRNLFLYHDPLGQKLKIGNQWFTIIGVMEDKMSMSSGKTDLPIQDMNQDVYIPLSTAFKRFPRLSNESEINRFVARVEDVTRIQEAANIIKSTMERRHNRIENFSITVPEALLRQSQKTQRIFNIVMGAIAGISLLVGGIGIMNIMLATVLERTREIGIRRAIGATRTDILGQFLLEAVMLSFTGGLIGIILGFALTRVIAVYADWRTIVSWQAIFLAFWVSVAVGIIFGVYPARRAARMRPIEALRYE